MAKVLSFGKGYRTYLCALAVGVIAVAKYLGYLDDSKAQLLYGLMGFGGLTALRAAL